MTRRVPCMRVMYDIMYDELNHCSNAALANALSTNSWFVAINANDDHSKSQMMVLVLVCILLPPLDTDWTPPWQEGFHDWNLQGHYCTKMSGIKRIKIADCPVNGRCEETPNRLYPSKSDRLHTPSNPDCLCDHTPCPTPRASSPQPHPVSAVNPQAHP